jgi:site-specific recombinase XerC
VSAADVMQLAEPAWRWSKAGSIPPQSGPIHWQQTEYSNDEDFIFASAALRGKQPLWGQTMNAQFVKPAAIELGLADESEHFGWHRFRHSLSTWANETTKDITVSQTMLRHAKPDTTAIYTHGNFGKALDAQRVYMEQLLRMKAASESTQ